MKKICWLFGIVLLAVPLGCSRELDEEIAAPADDSRIAISIGGEINQTFATRVNDSGFCDGDDVGIYVVNYTDGAPGEMLVDGNQADNVRFTYDESARKWIPEYDIYFRDRYTHVDIIGYYPYSRSVSSVAAYPFELSKDQSTEVSNGLLGGYEASDFLWGKAADLTPTASRIDILFNHIMASVQVELAEGTGFAEGEFMTLDKSVLVMNTVRKSLIDLSTGKVVPDGDVPQTGTVPFRSGSAFRAVVVPQTVEADRALFSITVDGTAYIFRKSTPFEYNAGKMHKFTIGISKKGDSGLEFELLGESITVWENDNASHDATAREYVIVDCHTPADLYDEGMLERAIRASGNDPASVKNMKLTGEINAVDVYFMRDNMPILQSLNLKEVRIVAGYSSQCGGCEDGEMPSSAFRNKTTLVRVVLPESIKKIADWAFEGTNISGSMVIPEGVSEIGVHAFYSCNGLTSLQLPRSLKKIDNYAFCGCRGLSGTLDIPESVTYIGTGAFENCSGFTGNLILPDNLELLGNRAFFGCSGFIGSLKIPEKIIEIADRTFTNCSGLNGTLILPHNTLTIGGEFVFSGCGFRGPLNLPESVVAIGPYAFSGCNFSGDLVLPEGLATIGNNAFASCSRLTGVVEIPEGIVLIPSYAFGACSQLEGVVIPRSVEVIQASAFDSCFQLGSITCKAENPPMLDASAFDGVAKDNFTVEVPEASLADYTLAPNWREFRRFAAHREFSVSRNLFRALNAATSKTVVMRAPAGASWSVESKPEWVSVTPLNGVGKEEVTITVDAMSKGSGDRTGEVVFLLDGKDYRSRTTVEQYDYEYGDGDVKTVQTATRGDGVNLVFMGDCFDAKDIAEGSYLAGIEEAIGYYFDVEPYKSYRDYFNVYIVFGMSPDSGIGDVNTIREAKFGTQYSMQGSGGLSPDETLCFEYACKAPTVSPSDIARTLITMIENSEEYDGITYMYGDGSAIALCPMSRDDYPYDFRGIVQHEAGGHGFGKLGDEYIYHNAFLQTCNCIDCGHIEEFNEAKAHGWYDNLSLTGNMYDVPWSHLIFDEKYANTVDIYEGGFKHSRGVFRSEQKSCMNNNIPYFSAISRESIVRRIKEYAGETFSFEDFKAKDVALATDTRAAEFPAAYEFSAGLQKPAISQHSGPVYMGEKPSFGKSNK